MEPLFIISAVRAAIRIGRTAADAFEQYAQEKPILIPYPERLPGRDMTVEIRSIARDVPEFAALLESDPELIKLWQNNRPTAVPEAEQKVLAVALRIRARSGGTSAQVGAQAVDEIAGGVLVAQWAEGKGPVTPAVRIVVALADVALEYVGTNPQVLGIGGDGEKLIGAIAMSLGQAIPDADTREALGPRDRFAERLAALALQSGLKALSENPQLVFGQDHLQALLTSALPPIVEALPQGADTLREQVVWRNLTDALLGPALNAALTVLAENRTAFFGKRFAAGKAAGVMVNGLLLAVRDQKREERFTSEGWLSLFQAVVGVAAEHPELVLGELLDKDLSDPNTRKAAEELALGIFTSIAETLSQHKAPFSDEFGIAVAQAAIEGLKTSQARLFDKDKPWEKIASEMAGQVLSGLAEALGDEEKTLRDTVFSRGQLIELARVVVAQVAETPHLVKYGNQEVRRVVASVASAMAKDSKLLLTAEDWTEIARVAAQEAALNPGRLFGLNDKALQGKLAEDIIGRLLQTAAQGLERTDAQVGPLLIGETLREAIVLTLRGIGGNVEAAFERRADIEALARKLNEVAAARDLSLGGKEWLRLFRALLPGVLSKGVIPELDESAIAKLLGQKEVIHVG